uniref:NADH-ubiquinone oxidoreductase chain 4 n=1 Tax=Magadhaideus sp. n. SX-2018 TaxID=2220057 RepID=A0A3S5XHQ1_9HEMI|nr:NADH dehydrogenase subunit 4 [Magadhaideus sp. n. SX-2018]
MLKFIFYIAFLTPICVFSKVYLYLYLVFFFFFFFFFSFFTEFDFFCLVSYDYGLDSVSFIFCCLSIWICLLMLLSVFSTLSSSFNLNYFLLYLNFLLFMLLMVFIVFDFFQFYFFFECSLIPVFLSIFGWGYQPERLKAGFFIIFYTLFASFPFLISIFYVVNNFGCFNFFFSFFLVDNFLMFFILFSFLVSFPLFGVHLWLPSAHVEAPVMGSMILAGVMLKLGGYGLIRCLKFLYFYFFCYGYFYICLSLFGCLFVSLFCLIQSDLKILIAYSSVCHMSVVISGIFTMTSLGVLGSLVFMVGHGFVSSGLFYLVGLVYERLGSRSFFLLSGLIGILPSMTFYWFMFCVMNMSCPPSINLFSEICIVISLVSWSFMTVYFLIFILFFSACYSLMIFSFSQHGESSYLLKFFCSCNVREYYVLFLHMFPVFTIVLSMDFFF